MGLLPCSKFVSLSSGYQVIKGKGAPPMLKNRGEPVGPWPCGLNDASVGWNCGAPNFTKLTGPSLYTHHTIVQWLFVTSFTNRLQMFPFRFLSL